MRSSGVSVLVFFGGLFDFGPAAFSISPAFSMNFVKTSSLRMESFKNLRYSKSLTEFFWPAGFIDLGRNPVVFHAYMSAWLPDCYCVVKGAMLRKLVFAMPYLFPKPFGYAVTPKKSSRSRSIYFVRWIVPSESRSVQDQPGEFWPVLDIDFDLSFEQEFCYCSFRRNFCAVLLPFLICGLCSCFSLDSRTQ